RRAVDGNIGAAGVRGAVRSAGWRWPPGTASLADCPQLADAIDQDRVMNIAGAGPRPQRHGHALDEFVALVLVELPLVEFLGRHRAHLGLGHAAPLDRAQGNTCDGPLEVSLSLRRRGYDESPTAPCLSRRPPSRHNGVRKQRRRERNSCPRRSTKFPSIGPSAPGSTRRDTKRCTRTP